MKKAIITVTGADHPGIIAAVSQALARLDINIVNVSQTLMDQYFTMIMQLEFDDSRRTIAEIQAAMSAVENAQKLVIHVQAEELFTAMNKL
ncbi:MAG: ACT domain-containing protein [Actinomycetaceae bacterium]|nr:ACT domain-containing protein [Arcanobacterium sp.]MDD7687439.1 ACT domain-containing protein [Actinomycetaceae bacterium]MDY5272913.1 ACT domain-containing protein [Arcanobacterium sp.]